MEICSDEQFEDLSKDSNLIQSQIDVDQPQLDNKTQINYTVEIIPLESSVQINFFEKQQYSMSIFFKGNAQIKGLKRRFSDFDLFFNALFRTYHGYILPAFPQNGLVSFIKSKVTVSKDDQYLKSRMHMIQRFMQKLLNTEKFNIQKCSQMKKFLSENQFDLFKKQEKINTQGFISSSWNKFMGYIKMNKQNKYKVLSEELTQNKKQYFSLCETVKEIGNLIDAQIKQYNKLSQKELSFRNFNEYCKFVAKVEGIQKETLAQLREFQFQLQCQNYDFIMAMKTIHTLEELKDTDIQLKQLKCIDQTFDKEYNIFKKTKDKKFKQLHKQFCQLLKKIKRNDQKLREDPPLSCRK